MGTLQSPVCPEPEPRQERRRYPRHPCKGLVAIIAGQVGKVIDVSAGGIRLELRGPIGRDITSFALYPRSGDRVALNNGIHARGIVVHEEGTHVGLRFQPATLALARFLADHIDAQD